MPRAALALLTILLVSGCVVSSPPAPINNTAATPTGPTPTVSSAPAPGPSVGVEAVRAALNATPGHDVTFAITLTNRGTAGAALGIEASGDGVLGRAPIRELAAGAGRTTFLTVTLPASLAPGDHALHLRVVNATGGEARALPAALTLHVLPPSASGFADGDSADIMYVGRLAETGATFNTNDAALQRESFDQTPTYSFSTGVLSVQTRPRPQVVTGVYEGMLGMQPGETRTVTFGPEKGYGNSTVETPQGRVKLVDRIETINLPGARLSPSDFQNYLNDTKQGNASSYHVGSTLVNEANGQTLRYRIVNVSDAGYEMRLDVHVGEKYSVYDFWPNASEAVTVSDIDVTFKTTPTTQSGDNFTYYPYWPKMSAVTSINETTIVVTHTPPVGFRYTVNSGPGGTAEEFTVKRLTPTEVITLTPGSSWLAGKDLTFDITLLSLAEP